MAVEVFRKRPILVEALQFTGENVQEVLAFCPVAGHDPDNTVRLASLRGQLTATNTDWIVRGVAGDYYVCRDVSFRATHREVKHCD